jgi:cytidylate kinase
MSRSQERRLATLPFITISRQAGTGGSVFGHLLAQRLNHMLEPEAQRHPWTCLNRELVERIAADHHLSADLIASLEHSSHSWIAEFFHGLSHSDTGTPSEMAIFRRVVQTVRGLAATGHVILVGLGSVFITRDIPAAIHVRIIAPFNWRVENFARTEALSLDQAREKIQLLDNDRQAFIQKFFPNRWLTPEIFHMTLNAGVMTDEQMSAAVGALAISPAASASPH